MIIVAIAAAGGFGAVARFVIDSLVRTHLRSRHPWGTTMINISGSLLLGLVFALTARQVLPEPWHQVIGVGFLGGYTTFSTASFETIRLLQEHRIGLALRHGFGMLAISVAAAALGWWLGSR